MKNTIPSTIALLRVAAVRLANGADQYGGTIPLVINTKALIEGDTTGLVEAVTAYEGADTELNNRRETKRLATEAGNRWLTLAAGTFKLEFGSRYNQDWDPTGLNRSLRIPRDDRRVLAMLGSFKEFLTANSTFEMGTVTAAQAGTLFDALEAAIGAVDTQKTHVKNMIADRDAKFKALRKRISTTIAELGIRLGSLDPKWLSFGLNMPGAPTTPQAPLNITAVLIGPNAVSVQWEPSVYASYYRVWAKVIGVDEELINVGDSTNLEFTMQGMTAGAQVQIAVSAAVTGGGESAKSEIVTITVPA